MKTTIEQFVEKKEKTAIYALAKNANVDVSKSWDVFQFVLQSAKDSEAIRSKAFELLGYPSSNYRTLHKIVEFLPNKEPKILQAIKYAKYQKQQGKSNYSKVLVIGNSNIYWASHDYGHSDYNKSIAMPNTPKNREVAKVINRYLSF